VRGLCYAPNQARVGSDRGQTGTRHGGWTWLQRGSPLRRLGLRVLYFNKPRTARMLVDVETIWWVKTVTGQEYGSTVSTL